MQVGDIVKWGAWNEKPEYALVLREPSEDRYILVRFFNDCEEYILNVSDLEVISESR